MLGQRTLLVNPPPIEGIRFTRQGRCQAREDVLGTTTPPYTLVLLASLKREAGCEVRLIDQTAENLSAKDLIARLKVEKFTPTIVIFCSTTPTLEADAAEILTFKEHWKEPIF